MHKYLETENECGDLIFFFVRFQWLVCTSGRLAYVVSSMHHQLKLSYYLT